MECVLILRELTAFLIGTLCRLEIEKIAMMATRYRSPERAVRAKAALEGRVRWRVMMVR